MKRHRQPVITIEDDEDWPADINDKQLETDLSTGREERIEQLEKLIDLLPADERMLLTLYYFDDRPLAEIAYITGIDAKALANRLYRIRKKLYKQMR
jgi:RNA polymerase sigma-70 factor (ECF subfamily)